MPLVLQLHLVSMNKSFNTFLVMAYTDVFAQQLQQRQQRQSSDHSIWAHNPYT